MSPSLDFGNTDNVKDFSPVPEGEYLCRVLSIEEKQTGDGSDMWKLTHVIVSGEYSGRHIFDTMPFTENAMSRAKLICSRLGLDVSGKVDLTTDMLKGKPVWITVEMDSYEKTLENGEQKKVKTNKVTFAGYRKCDDEAVKKSGEFKSQDGEDIPF